MAPAPGNSSQAIYTITYGNPSQTPVENAVVRFPLDEQVSFVSGSASPGARYDAALREVVWNLGLVPSGKVDQKLTLRVEPIERRPTTFKGMATIQDASGLAIASNEREYSNFTTPLLTVFAFPDRILAAKNGALLLDVKGIDNQMAVDRLAVLGVAQGRSKGLYYPASPTQRAEYAVMTLNGLNLRDLRDITQIKYVLAKRSLVNLSIRDAGAAPSPTWCQTRLRILANTPRCGTGAVEAPTSLQAVTPTSALPKTCATVRSPRSEAL